MKLPDLTADARTLSAEDFGKRHGPVFLLGIAGSLRPPKRFEQTRSGPASPAPLDPKQNIDWLILPVVKRDKSLSIHRITVGRTGNNDVSVEDPSVSRLHAFFEPDVAEPGGFTVRDAGSRLGTRVNGAAAATDSGLKIRSGDQVQFGDVEFTFMDVTSLVYFVDRMSPRL